MKALIFENEVVDIQATEFDVHPSMVWVDCDNTVKMGFSYDGSTFTAVDKYKNELTAEEIATLEANEQADADLKDSGNQKLLDLGLTQAEVTALTGYTPS